MRIFVYAVAALAVIGVSSPGAVRAALATCTSALFEATPFLIAGLALSRILGRRRIVEYLGCGCGDGPSARSLPAAIATWLLFGPSIAVARFIAAFLVDRFLHRATDRSATFSTPSVSLLHQLAALVPAAILAGIAVEFFGTLKMEHLSPMLSAALGTLLGFAAAPCGLGAIVVAGALRVRAPIAAATFLCIAGIADLSVVRPTARRAVDHDVFAYTVLAAALAVVALRRGDALVHPAFVAALACCACVSICFAAVYRKRRSVAGRIAPILMLVGALVGAPPPQYRASETTLGDLFAGEHLTFTGALAREGTSSTIVRYAITCCRADAVPVAVRLDRSPSYSAGTWLRVTGTVANVNGTFRLRVASIARLPPPLDPFIYR